MNTVRLGREWLLVDPAAIMGGSRVGPRTNSSKIGLDFRTTIDRCVDHPPVVRGKARAGEHVAAGRDPTTGLSIRSLYDETRAPAAHRLAGPDTIVVDLQDIGVR